MSLMQSDELDLARLLEECKTQSDGVDVNRHEIAELNRDFEYRATNKIPSIFFQFEWTIEHYNVQCIEGCQSPNLELPYVTLTFFLKRVPLPDNRQHFDVLSVSSTSTTISLSGSVQFNGETFPVNHAMVSKHETILKIPLITSSLKQLKTFLNITVHYLDKKNSTLTKMKHGVNVLNEDQYRQELQKNVQGMFRSSKLSDVRLKSSHGSIDAHKNILSARSPAFAHMFKYNKTSLTACSNTVESSACSSTVGSSACSSTVESTACSSPVESTACSSPVESSACSSPVESSACSSPVESSVMVIDVKDVPNDILEHFVGFLYGHIPNFEAIRDLKKLCELYCVSDEYQVLSLRNMCGQVLLSRISEENVSLLREHFGNCDNIEFSDECVKFCCMELNNDESGEIRKLVLADPTLKTKVFEEITKPKYGSVTEDT